MLIFVSDMQCTLALRRADVLPAHQPGALFTKVNSKPKHDTRKTETYALAEPVAAMSAQSPASMAQSIVAGLRT